MNNPIIKSKIDYTDDIKSKIDYTNDSSFNGKN